MVVNKFLPRVQVLPCNSANAAQELQIDASLHDALRKCVCQMALLRSDQEHLNKEWSFIHRTPAFCHDLTIGLWFSST